MLPFWAVLGHNILYITAGFVWPAFADHGGATEEEITIRQGPGGYGYQLAALVLIMLFVWLWMRDAQTFKASPQLARPA